MKIGVITSVYPESKDDPHGIFVHRLMKEVAALGYEVNVIAPYSGGKKKYEIDGISVEKFHYFYPTRFQRLCGGSGMIDNFKEGIFVKAQVFTFVLSNIINSFKLRDMDVIHVQWPIPNGFGAVFLKKIFKIPYINTVYGEEVRLSKLYHTLFLIKYFIRNSFKSVVISKGSLDASAKVGLNTEKFELIPFGVDTKFFKPLNNIKEKQVFKILSVGYLIERKGFEYLIESVTHIKKAYNNVELTIIGSGPLEKKLKKCIIDSKLEKEVKIKKNISNNELLDYYNSADVFVLPSIIDSQGNTEGLGVVLLEAMACGIPVIGSNIGGIPDIIKNNETGLLVSQKDSLMLSEAIIRLIENEPLRNKIANGGLNYVRANFSWEIIAKKYVNIYSAG